MSLTDTDLKTTQIAVTLCQPTPLIVILQYHLIPGPYLVFPNCLKIFLWLVYSNQDPNQYSPMYLANMLFNGFPSVKVFPPFFGCVCVCWGGGVVHLLYPEELGSVFLENFLRSGLGWLLFHSFIWHVLWPLHFWEICHCVRSLIRFGRIILARTYQRWCIWPGHINVQISAFPGAESDPGVGVLSAFLLMGLELLVVNAWTNSLCIHPFPSSEEVSFYYLQARTLIAKSEVPSLALKNAWLSV